MENVKHVDVTLKSNHNKSILFWLMRKEGYFMSVKEGTYLYSWDCTFKLCVQPR